MRPSRKKVAIVVVSYNEASVITDTLEACEEIDFANKIILAADDSDDGVTYNKLLEWIEDRGGKELSPSFLHRTFGACEIWRDPQKRHVLLHRFSKEGFKAGCLKTVTAYLQQQGIEYMYLLDADWKPEPDILKKTLSVLEADEQLAFVQTRRQHFNRLHGVFQHSASISEESGYEVEYLGRQVLDHPILFTGCCTLFRVEAIKDAGGFTPGHLTEDIDLTNRLYLRGWKGRYLPSATNQGEVAPSYRSLIRQQERWAQGTARSLKEFWHLVMNSVHLNWFERLSLLRQNFYYFTATAIEASVLIALVTILWIGFFPESYGANLYLLYMSRIATPYTVLLFIALFSNFLPIIVAVLRRRHYHELVYVFFTSWLFWSLLHTYFWANVKGFLDMKTDWFKTPKLNGRRIVDPTKASRHRLVFNTVTLSAFVFIYFMEWYVYGWISPYAYFWVPAMTVGIFST